MIINYDKEQDHIECPAELKPYKFLFFHYKPECYSAESKECLRRIALMGGVALLSTTGHGNGVENALFGMVLSMSFALLQREQNPWDKPETNALANGFSWVVFFVFFGACELDATLLWLSPLFPLMGPCFVSLAPAQTW